MWFRTTVSFAVLVVRPAPAQDSLGGKWLVHMAVTAPGGFVPTTGVPTSASLVISMRGDSVSATWQSISPDGTPPYPMIKLTGAVVNGTVTLSAPIREHTLSMPDGDRVMRSQTVYRFALQRGAIAGTIETLQLDSDVHLDPIPFTAERPR